MPFLTPFGSRNWEARQSDPNGLGELPGPRAWLEGDTPANCEGLMGDALAVACAESHADWWTAGLGPGDVTGPYDSAGRPLCCLRVPESECSPAPPFDCLTISDTLSCAVTSQASACATGDQTVTATRTGPTVCEWQGVVVTFAGDAAFTLTYSAGAWSLVIDCFLGPVAGVVVSFTESPFNLVVDVPDDTWCCSPGGGGGIRLTFTI